MNVKLIIGGVAGVLIVGLALLLLFGSSKKADQHSSQLEEHVAAAKVAMGGPA